VSYQGGNATINAAELERRLTTLENCKVSCSDHQALERRVASLEAGRGF